MNLKNKNKMLQSPGKLTGYIVKIFIALIFYNVNTGAQNLEDYLKMAAENNPGLKSKFYSYQASLEKLPQVSALPDPQISFGIFIEPMERFMGNQVAEISVMQMFPWFGTLSAAEDEAAAMAKAKYEEFNETKTMLFYEVKTTWYALYLLQKEISITEENIEILETLEEIAISRLKSGGTSGSGNSSGSGGMKNEQPTGSSGNSGMSGMGNQSPANSGSMKPQSMNSTNQMSSGNNSMVDVLRVQIEANELKNNLSLLKDNMQPLLVQFNKLLNRPADEFIIIPDTLTPELLPATVSEMPDSIKRNNPMLRMLQIEEEAYLAQEKMNRRMGFPMIGIGLQYSVFQQRAGTMMPPENMLMPMATISIPLWRSKYNASVQESRFMRDAVVEQRSETGNQLLISYEEALKDFKDAERRIELYQLQTILSKQVLDILTVQYTTAGTAFEEVLRIQQQLLDYRLRSLDAVVDQNIASAMLERLMGR